MKYWHFILAFVGGLITGIIAPLTTNHLHWIAIGVELVLVLAFWYEWHQAVDTDMLNKYGNWKNFRKDSLSDVKQDLAGLFTGLITGLIISSIIKFIQGG